MPGSHIQGINMEPQSRTASTTDRVTAQSQQFTGQQPLRQGKRQRAVVWIIGLGSLLALVVSLIYALSGGLILGISFSPLPKASATNTTSQTFQVNAVPSLAIQDDAGIVIIQPQNTSSVTAQITKITRDSSSSIAQADLSKIKVTSTQVGNKISITTNFQSVLNSRYGRSAAVNLLISVPAATNITANVKAGNVQATSVSGLMALTVGAGDITLQGVSLADGSHLTDTAGKIHLNGALNESASVSISDTSGDVVVQLPATTAVRLDAQTTVGNISVTGWSIQPARQNVSGATAQGSLGATASGVLQIRVDTGDITIHQQ
jgi:hypothetical protein